MFTFVTAVGISKPNTYKLVCLSSNGHGAFYLSAIVNHNAYYVAIDSHNKVQVLSASDIANVSSYIGGRVCENRSCLFCTLDYMHKNDSWLIVLIND